MDKIQIYSALFDASCFVLSHFECLDDRAIDLDSLRSALRVIIRDSATAKVLEVEKQLGLDVEKK